MLDQPDYYARIYSLQLLTAISSSRPERTQECILQAPLGTARLVGVLDDARDAVRNAALLLLVDLTNVSQTELQKLIAFEDAFQRIFNLIQGEGGLAEGGIVVQDCLSLLANLIRHSASNQSLFRESGCIPRLVEAVKQSVTVPPDENEFSRANREKNSWGLLAVLGLFLEKGELGTKQNQEVFWRAGLVQMILRLAFDSAAPPMIRTNALKTCADMIIHNTPLQESFAALQVPQTIEPQPPTNGVNKATDARTIYVIEALLDLVLVSSPSRPLELRASACALIEAYFAGHQRIKLHFLQRAIAGYTEGEEETSNCLSTLLNGPQGPADPVRFALAGDIISQLLFDEPEAKRMLMSVQEGDAEKGEDVVSATQLLTGHLLACLQNDLDPQLSIAYLALLITFLFDAPEVINDCLAEGSSLVGALMSTAVSVTNSQVSSDPLKSLLPGLCATLLGTIYEFSTKDSPIPRRTLHPLLQSNLGRQKYFDALTQFRSHPDIRDFELLAESGAPEREIISILFDVAFIDWFKDEYGRLKRAIDRDPGVEVFRKAEIEVDRDILDDLRDQIKSKDEALQQMEKDGLVTRQRADSAAADQRREVQSLQSSQRALEAEIERIKRINEALQRDHDADMQRVQGELRSQIAQARLEARNQAESLQQNHAREIERLKGAHGASLASERSLWEDKARKAADQAARELSTALERTNSEHRTASAQAAEEHRLASERTAEENRKAVEQATQEHQAAIDELTAKVQQHETTIKQREDALQDHEKATKGLKQDYQNAKTSLEKIQSEQTDAKKTIERLEKEVQQSKRHQEGLQEVNTKAMARVKTLEEEGKQKDGRIKNLVEERDQYQTEKDEVQSKVKDLEQEIESLKSELAAERKGYGELEAELEKAKAGPEEARAELGKIKADLKNAHTGPKELESELDKAQAETKKAKAELEKAKTELQKSKQGKGGAKGDSEKLAQLEKELSSSKAEVQKEKEETKKARSELEDMLMVLADLEGKRESYREKLKRLGEEVSDDDDDEEDEDDDEDDNEDDNEDEDDEEVD